MRDEASRLLRRLGSSIAPGLARWRSFDRPAADRRDRQGPRDRRAHSRHGRADRRARPRRRDASARSRAATERQGVSIVYISHRMPEIQAVADRVTVLKDGRTVMTAPLAEAPTGRLVRAMVGRELVRLLSATCLPSAPGPRRSHSRRARTGASKASTSTCVRAKSSASRVSRARARMRSAAPSPATSRSKRSDGNRRPGGEATKHPRARSRRARTPVRRPKARGAYDAAVAARQRHADPESFRQPVPLADRRADVDSGDRPAAETARRARGELRPGGPAAFGRQSAARHHRPLARARSRSSRLLRADARRRRRRQGGDLQDHARSRRRAVGQS